MKRGIDGMAERATAPPEVRSRRRRRRRRTPTLFLFHSSCQFVSHVHHFVLTENEGKILRYTQQHMPSNTTYTNTLHVKMNPTRVIVHPPPTCRVTWLCPPLSRNPSEQYEAKQVPPTRPMGTGMCVGVGVVDE